MGKTCFPKLRLLFYLATGVQIWILRAFSLAIATIEPVANGIFRPQATSCLFALEMKAWIGKYLSWSKSRRNFTAPLIRDGI